MIITCSINIATTVSLEIYTVYLLENVTTKYQNLFHIVLDSSRTKLFSTKDR